MIKIRKSIKQIKKRLDNVNKMKQRNKNYGTKHYKRKKNQKPAQIYAWV